VHPDHAPEADPQPTPPNTTPHAHDFGPNLETLLHNATHNRLAPLQWFRTDWQRGGAATAYTTIDPDSANPRQAVAKFPLGPREHQLLSTLADTDAPTPRVAFHGTELGSLDLAWIVMERLPGEPLRATTPNPNKKIFTEIADAAARFYANTNPLWPHRQRPQPWDWHTLVNKSRQSCKTNPIDNAQHWNKVLHDVHKHLDDIARLWESRDANTWCHGDLHLNNIMRRPNNSPWLDNPDDTPPQPTPADQTDDTHHAEGDLVLIDFGEMRPGHWVEDAVYLERVYWANPQVATKVKFVPIFAKARKAHGLPCDDDYPTLAHARRLLMAACAPAWLHRENHPSYLNAALAVIEKTLPLLTK
jgi:aminoglycoside phosphotransferase (APT) family kinase protein